MTLNKDSPSDNTHDIGDVFIMGLIEMNCNDFMLLP